MVRVFSYAYCYDDTGVYFVKMFRSADNYMKKDLTIGDKVLVTVRGVNLNSHFLKDNERKQRRYKKGSIHYALIIHVAEKYKRSSRTFIWFRRNAVVLVGKKKYFPIGKRIKREIPKEIVKAHPFFGLIATKIV